MSFLIGMSRLNYKNNGIVTWRVGTSGLMIVIHFFHHFLFILQSIFELSPIFGSYSRWKRSNLTRSLWYYDFHPLFRIDFLFDEIVNFLFLLSYWLCLDLFMINHELLNDDFYIFYIFISYIFWLPRVIFNVVSCIFFIFMFFNW